MFKTFLIVGCIAATPTTLFAAGSLDEAMAELSSAIVSSLPTDGAPTMAISTFTHSGNTCSNLSNYISELMLPSIATAGQNSIRLIARSQLTAIFRELQLVYDGTISPGAAQQIGNISAVEAILTGTITPFGDSMMVMSTLIATSDGAVLGSATANFPITDTVRSLLQEQNATLCGFSGPGTGVTQGSSQSAGNGTAPARLAPSEAARFVAPEFEAQVVTLNYAPKTGVMNWSIRFANLTEQTIALSYIPKTISISDGHGGVTDAAETWSGLKVCYSGRVSNCSSQQVDQATTIAPGKFAQLNFSATVAKDVTDLLATLTMDMVVTPDIAQNDIYEVRSVGFFDLPASNP